MKLNYSIKQTTLNLDENLKFSVMFIPKYKK